MPFKDPIKQKEYFKKYNILNFEKRKQQRFLKKEELKKYIRYIADRRLIGLGMKGIFKVKRNPLPWVEEMINAPTHTNFFENRATDYAKAAYSGTWDDVWGKAA